MKRKLLCLAILLGGLSLVNAQSAQVRSELANGMLSNGDITQACVREQGGTSKAITITAAYLNADKQAEYIVSGDGSCCVGARRCLTWIYQKRGNGYRKIFGDLQGDIEVLKTRTQGYKNLRSTVYSGNESYSAIHKWNGTQYR
jgi:hypothetical protein